MVLSARSAFHAADALAPGRCRAGLQMRRAATAAAVGHAVAAQFGYNPVEGMDPGTRATTFTPSRLFCGRGGRPDQNDPWREEFDDFCRVFMGPPSTAPKVVPYDFDSGKASNGVMLRLARIWTERVNRGSAERRSRSRASGWRLVFVEEPRAEKGDARLTGNRFVLFARHEIKATGGHRRWWCRAPRRCRRSRARLIVVGSTAQILQDILQDALKAEATVRAHDLLIQKDDMISTAACTTGKIRYPARTRPGSADLLSRTRCENP